MRPAMLSRTMRLVSRAGARRSSEPRPRLAGGVGSGRMIIDLDPFGGFDVGDHDALLRRDAAPAAGAARQASLKR